MLIKVLSLADELQHFFLKVRRKEGGIYSGFWGEESHELVRYEEFKPKKKKKKKKMFRVRFYFRVGCRHSDIEMATTGNVGQVGNNSELSGNDSTVYLGKASLVARSGIIALLNWSFYYRHIVFPDPVATPTQISKSSIIQIPWYYHVHMTAEVPSNYHSTARRNVQDFVSLPCNILKDFSLALSWHLIN